MLHRISILLLFVSALCQGQATSSLRGTIKDTSGAVIPDTAITLTDAATGALRNVISDKNGEYQILQVTPGKYILKVEKPGFSTLTKSDITLEVNVPETLDCVLEVGSVGSTVNVEAESTANKYGRRFGRQRFSTKNKFRELPLQTRNVVELLSIQPGVTQTGEVLGARRDQNNVTLDGVDVNNNQNSGITSAQTNGSQASRGQQAIRRASMPRYRCRWIPWKSFA